LPIGEYLQELSGVKILDIYAVSDTTQSVCQGDVLLPQTDEENKKTSGKTQKITSSWN